MNERMYSRVWWSSLQVVLFVFMKEIYLNPQSNFYSQADVHPWNILYSKGALCMLNVWSGHPLLSIPIHLINSNNLFACASLPLLYSTIFLLQSPILCFHNIPSISFYPLQLSIASQKTQTKGHPELGLSSSLRLRWYRGAWFLSPSANTHSTMLSIVLDGLSPQSCNVSVATPVYIL